MATASKKVKKIVKVVAKTSAKTGKEGKKLIAGTGKDGKKLTPIQLAQLARKNGTSKSKAKSKKKALPVFKAPEDFKPFFMKALVSIDKDSIITDMKVTRIKGSPTNENAKTVDMGLHDPDTLRKIAVRFAGAAFIRSEKKRLPPKSKAMILMRASANKETRALKVSIKEIRFLEDGAKKPKNLEKKDPVYRALRKPVRMMPAAFTKVKTFPSAADLKALLKAED